MEASWPKCQFFSICVTVCHVEIVQANDRDLVGTTGACTTLFAQSTALDKFVTPAPIGSVRDAVELYVGNRRLLCDLQRLSLLNFILYLDEF